VVSLPIANKSSKKRIFAIPYELLWFLLVSFDKVINMHKPTPDMSYAPLYDPQYERDNCGIGFVARINGRPGHDILNMAIIALGNQAHRGAVAADANTGDGAGVLTQIPRALFLRELERQGVLAEADKLAVGMLFLPRDNADAETSSRIITQTLHQRGLTVLGWREVPTNDRVLGQRAKDTKPRIRQVIIGRPDELGEANFERTLLLARKEMEATFRARNLPVYIPSMSSRTIVYKGLLVGTHLGCFYLDLRDPTYETAIAVYHQRYSTNTFPTWERAQPFRMVSHNGEINTLQGNINWTRARQSKLHFPEVPGKKDGTVNIITSVIEEQGSDSAMFDNALEVLVQGGRDVRHAVAMMAPEAWEKVSDMEPSLRAFYQYHACLEEPWDGPAALTFSDGSIVGTSLDRNGLRPARYCITDDGLVVSGSEAGVVPLDDSRIVRKGRLGPGQMIAVDIRNGHFYSNEEVKQMLAARKPYAQWVSQHLKTMETLPKDEHGLANEDGQRDGDEGHQYAEDGHIPPMQDGQPAPRAGEISSVAEQVASVAGQVASMAGNVAAGSNDKQASGVAGRAASIAGEAASVANHASAVDAPRAPLINLATRQMAFGYTTEEISVILKPMMRDAREPVGSMGDDTPLAVLSNLDLGRPLFQYFKQRFAEVTNPPIDPLREGIVMSLSVRLGARLDVLEETPEHAHLLQLESPILTDERLAAIRANTDPRLRTMTLNAVMPVAKGGTNIRGEMELRQAVERLCNEAEQAAYHGATLLIISDRNVDANCAPIPSLLAVGAVHHHLIRTEWRGRVSLLVESGDPREVHDMACLIGYGAKAINPYLAMATVRGLADERMQLTPQEAEQNYIQALEKGILKIMSKMGISPLESYCGAQIFEAIGLNKTLVDLCFAGTKSRLGGIGFEKIARDVLARHRAAFSPVDDQKKNGVSLPHPGFYKFKKDGEYHSYGPSVVRALHDAVMPKEGTNGNIHAGLDAEGNVSMTGYLRYRVFADMVNNRPPSEIRDLLDFVPAGSPIQLDEVEPIEDILCRFSTAAMSHGAMSSESHETLSIAMNRLGGMGNSGEGGEAIERYNTERNSRIKQVASGRFGVTPTYLMSADEIQIKMAQGSKPGEGGHLPGHKVSAEIARIRHTTPGVPLISPPPHHDIYSIEDLAQLIYDLKRTNPGACVSVKLVSLSGVGTVAAGVAKGYADGILISGSTGGTGASPLSSIKHAGMPWEIGLAETQQTLMLNGLRGRVRLRVDGGFQTGRDVLVAAMLGADDFSFGTIAMIAEGCRMARVCHNNTCPVGIATQRLDLRAKFPGQPEMVMAFFRYLAHEIRELLASLGLRSLDEAIGRTDLLVQKHTDLPNADNLDLTPILAVCRESDTTEMHHNGKRNLLPPEDALGDRILHDSRYALSGRGPVELNYAINNSDRTVGARLSGAISQMYGEKGLPADTVKVTLRGSSGQSFGAFLAPGVKLTLVGEANDYVGKGMAGGKIVIRPGEYARSFVWHENVIAGNTLLYGATGGELYIAGRVGERFAVRNSGATSVVEGVGDHGCEYMTGGMVVILGPTGYNFGAGMTGGVAYVLDEGEKLSIRYNRELIQLDRLSPHDEVEVQKLVRQHKDLTNSPHAAHILEHWTRYRSMFWRVMPKEMAAKIEASMEGQEEATPKAIHPSEQHPPVGEVVGR
jgi:glutamate synthase domain-containing protein 2/glutamate synthase domain-containing protein 1/glutamate synthase domain-containing protein 3